MFIGLTQGLDLPPLTPQRALAFALDNQDILHNYVQKSVILTTKLDALTLFLLGVPRTNPSPNIIHPHPLLLILKLPLHWIKKFLVLGLLPLLI